MAARPKPRKLAAAVVRARLAKTLPHWTLQGGQLVRRYQTGGWKGTLLAVNAIGHLAEAAWHHPDILATYPAVEVRLSTHEAGGISERDFALAAKIEEVIQWRPGRDGGALEGTPDDPRHAYLHYD
ncbi:MAG: 4a-hydroxytetrahydrobiopterin dehydratase [Alphaproteobacteria bacterium]|nr:4a-hydroxytetrahydrobiopterin dehydratase [Alphaproteobacteria bacterium]